MVAKEIESISRLQSAPIQIILNVLSLSNDRPVFGQDAYQVTLQENGTKLMFDKEILNFSVTVKDININGLYCYLLGVGAEK